MKQYANTDLVNRFVEMIAKAGPQPRLIHFFEAICTVNGPPVKVNQEK